MNKIEYKLIIDNNGEVVDSAILQSDNEINLKNVEFFVGDNKVNIIKKQKIDNKLYFYFDHDSFLRTIGFDIKKFVDTYSLPEIRCVISNISNDNYDVSFSYDECLTAFKSTFYQGKKGILSYEIYASEEKSIKRPLVVFLHGSGERGFNNRLQLLGNDVPKTIYNYVRKHEDSVILAPQATWAKELNGWFRPEVRATLMDLIHFIIKKENIDTNRIYLCGLSNGGAATWHFGDNYPELFAALIPCCGYIFNDNKKFLGGQGQGRYMEATHSEIEKLRDMPIWAFHANDDPVVNSLGTKNTVKQLKDIGNDKVKMTIYPDNTVTPNAHGCWANAYNNSELLPWLFAQHK